MGLMLAALEEADASQRKVSHFVAACYRRVWPFLDDVYRQYAEVTERLADGKATKQELKKMGMETDHGFELVHCGRRKPGPRLQTLWRMPFPK